VVKKGRAPKEDMLNTDMICRSNSKGVTHTHNHAHARTTAKKSKPVKRPTNALATLTACVLNAVCLKDK